ncbi:hypothetical protein [Tropicimonas sediminicola]|uniref:hypothetical protein n=1 Tax=Tropicimonas sediminicola TaxID=1031541 RepID=UPI001131C2E3|nr:hypothetical protein [Tropicimonas sediminicola]
MFFAFVLGPLLLVIWASAPLIVKPLVYPSLFGVISFSATLHSWAAHGISLAVKLAGLQVANEMVGLALGGSPLAGEFELLSPFSAVYLLTIGAILASLAEYIYFRPILRLRGIAGFRVLYICNISIDCIVALPALIFWVLLLSGKLHYI